LTKPAAQRRRGPAGYCMLILTLIIVIASLAAIFRYYLGNPDLPVVSLFANESQPYPKRI